MSVKADRDGFRFAPVDATRWDDLAKLFSESGACRGCWCMTWRKAKRDFERDRGEGNRKDLHDLVTAGRPPGILAYSNGEPIGWCAVAPREEYVALAKSKVLRPIDEQAVWAISCFFVSKRFRRQGITVGLLKAAIEFVKKEGGSILEGYPVLPKSAKMPDAFAWTGLHRSFVAAGFEDMPRWSEARPIVRYVIK